MQGLDSVAERQAALARCRQLGEGEGVQPSSGLCTAFAPLRITCV